MEFLVQSSYLDTFFGLVFEGGEQGSLATQIRYGYERKLYAIAITNLIFACQNVPAAVQGKIGLCLS
jgi:hypothetical protein